MEQSAFEAVMIGVNVFVFIIALTAGILLMTNILDMADYANQNVVTGMNGALAEVVGNVEERVYSGSQILTYYRRMIEEPELKYDFKIKIAATEHSLKNYIETQPLNDYIDSYFELSYKGVVSNKETYVFVKKD